MRYCPWIPTRPLHHCNLYYHTILNMISETIILLDRESRVRPQIPATRADIETILASSDGPLLRSNVPVTEIALAESERSGLSAAGSDGYLLEAAELTDGFVRDGGEGNVELSDLETVARTGVPSWSKMSASPLLLWSKTALRAVLTGSEPGPRRHHPTNPPCHQQQAGHWHIQM